MVKRRPLAFASIALLFVILAACGGDEDPFGPEEVQPGSGEDRPLDLDDSDPAEGIQPPPSDTDPGGVEPTENAPFEDRPIAPDDPAVVLEEDSVANVPDTQPEPDLRDEALNYTVQSGDTLGSIAAQFGVTIDAIIEANGLTNPDALDVGQELIIPPQVGGGEDLDPVDNDVAVPDRPEGFTTFIDSALAWIDARQSVGDCLLPLFLQWGMPPVVVGDRCHLVDANLDGRSSAVVIFTDPTPSDLPQLNSDLIIFEPPEEGEEGFRIAYRLANPDAGDDAFDVAILHTRDISGDVQPDIAVQELSCGATTCVTTLHVLSWDIDTEAYIDIAAGLIEIAGVTSIDFSDRTGDGISDVTIVGGAIGSVGAGPPCPGEYLYSAHSGTFQLVEVDRLPSEFLACAIAPANEAFAAGDYEDALSAYEATLGDPSLEAGGLPNERAELIAFAHLRSAIVLALQGDAAAATAAAQLGAAEEGLHALLANAFLSGYAGTGDVVAGCAALNNELALLVDQFDNFWSQLGYGLAATPSAEELCPF